MSADYAGQPPGSRCESAPPCAAPSCWRDAQRRRVDGREAVLCDRCAKTFLGVST